MAKLRILLDDQVLFEQDRVIDVEGKATADLFTMSATLEPRPKAEALDIPQDVLEAAIRELNLSSGPQGHEGVSIDGPPSGLVVKWEQP
jgi:hypothetical protein